MHKANEYRGNKYGPQGGKFLTAMAGVLLTLCCLVTPAPAATPEEQLQEFLQGQPFEFNVRFQSQKTAICAAQVEDTLTILRLLSQTSKTEDPAMEKITEFAEEMLTDNL